jgi:hypothetical protein
LHSQLVEIRVEEGDDSLWEGRGTIEVHSDGDVRERDIQGRSGRRAPTYGADVVTRMECCMSNYLEGGEACLKEAKEVSCRWVVAGSVAND